MPKTAEDPSSTDAATPVAKPVPPAVNRRSTLEYFSPTRATDRFWRLFSSREKVIENLKTLKWVIPITLVIWVYAEREQVVAPTGPNVSNVPIQINPDPTRYIELVGNQNPTVNLKLTGPQQAFDRVRQELTAIPSPLKIDLGAGVTIGRNEPVNIVDHIQDNDLFKRYGVTVLEADPPYLHVNVDELKTIELPIQVPPGITNLSDVSFDPPKVTVSGPESLVTNNGNLKAIAELIGLSQLNAPGKHTVPSITVTLSSQIPMVQEKLRIEKPQNSQVKVEMTVLDADVPGEIHDLPITLDISPSTANAYSVVVNDGAETVSKIKVTGPKDLIDALQQKRIPAEAMMKIIFPDDATNAEPKTLTYILPPGVKVDKEDADKKFNLVLKLRPPP
jgi:hypothetical protein